MSKINLTVQRKAVYDIVTESSDHPSAADIIERLRERGFHFAYGTVYNSLRYLSDAGLIRELKLGEAVSRYDSTTDEHYHIVCTKCGAVDEVFLELPEEWLAAVAARTGYSVSHAGVVLEGVCGKCAKKVQ